MRHGSQCRHFLTFLAMTAVVLLSACASSEVSRQAASEVDLVSERARSSGNAETPSIVDAYQNASQTTKGALIGGAAGAVTGAIVPGIGVVPGTASGLLLGGMYGAYIDAHTTLQDQIENRNVNVIILGDQVLIVLPSEQVFDDSTPRIRSQAYSTLDKIAALIRSWTTMSVKISAYTGGMRTSHANLQLSQKQAESVEKYLWAKGVNTRLLYAQGYGNSQRIQGECPPDWDAGENDRIEITLEKLPSS